MQQNQKRWPINQLFIFLATLSVVLAMMRYASEIITPLLLAIAISIVLAPLLGYLETKRIPKIISLVFITVLVLVPIVALGGFIGGEVEDFIRNYHSIERQFYAWLGRLSEFVNQFGFVLTKEDIEHALDKSSFNEIIQRMAIQTKNQFSNIFWIFFLVAFILMDSTNLYNKLLKLMKEKGGCIEDGMKIIEKIKTYFLIKVKTSLLTGIWILAVLWFYDIHYAFLWATLVFFLNFVPVIGSILAAIPAIIIALIDHGIMTAMWVMMWYLIVNTVIGNILEPNIMGKGLGLSSLTVFLSMIFWGWMFGPVGMILSVPLTMAMQFLFSQYDETKGFAFMLSDYQEKT